MLEVAHFIKVQSPSTAMHAEQRQTANKQSRSFLHFSQFIELVNEGIWYEHRNWMQV